MYIAKFSQEVELASPIVAHRECVNLVFHDVMRFLLPVTFRNHFINKADCFEECFTLFVVEVGCFTFACVELICGETHNEMIAKALGTFEQTDMAKMECIEGSVSNNFFQTTRPLRVGNVTTMSFLCSGFICQITRIPSVSFRCSSL